MQLRRLESKMLWAFSLTEYDISCMDIRRSHKATLLHHMIQQMARMP